MREKLFGKDLMLTFKVNEKDFTRNRKQPFSHVILFMLNLLRKSLGIEIDNFVRFMSEKLSNIKAVEFTSSAFVQNRKKINPSVFQHLSDVITTNYYELESSSIRLFHGLRILAVDGSLFTLPNNSTLKKDFGFSKNQTQTEIVQARSSVLYDVLNKFVLDSSISHVSVKERELALKHHVKCKKNDLIIYDRGYPGYDFFYKHITNSINFLMRMKVSESNVVKDFVKSGKRSVIIDFMPAQHKSFKDKEYTKESRLKIRLLRIELPNGEIEVLATSLIDSVRYPSKMFKELYFKRWGIETFYDELKNKLKVEYFTGYSSQSIEQDFYCAIFISNLQTVVVNGVQEELEEQNKEKKYDYKINTNLSYGFLKNRVLELLCSETPIEKVLKELEELFLKNTIPIRPGRTNPRKKDKFKNRLKPKVLKNQKDAI